MCVPKQSNRIFDEGAGHSLYYYDLFRQLAAQIKNIPDSETNWMLWFTVLCMYPSCSSVE